MDLPIELKMAVEKMVVGYKQAQLKKIAQDLSERYRNESGKGKTLLSKDIEAIVYSVVRMPATYGAVYSSLSYALEFYKEDMRSLIDVGAGSGAATWAASELLNLDSVTCVEREGAMRKIGEAIMKQGSGMPTSRWISMDLTKTRLTYSADLVVASYVLNEMAESERMTVLDGLWNSANKMLLIVEPGTPAGFAVTKATRTYMLSKGAHIVAPCPHEEECRLDDNDWCHFTCRIQRSRLHKLLKEADVPYEDEKYTYMAFVKKDNTKANARILRHPFVDKGQIGLEVCTAQENKKILIKKNNGSLFKTARKVKHGDSITL